MGSVTLTGRPLVKLLGGHRYRSRWLDLEPSAAYRGTHSGGGLLIAGRPVGVEVTGGDKIPDAVDVRLCVLQVSRGLNPNHNPNHKH